MDYQHTGSSSPSAPGQSRMSTNGHENGLSNSLHRLTLHNTSRSSLPATPTTNEPRLLSEPQRIASSPISPKPPASPLRRASGMVDRRSPSPMLQRTSSHSSRTGGNISGTPPRPNSRRSSFAPSASPSVAKMTAQIEEKEPYTASGVAKDYFERELALHEENLENDDTNAVVILHDSCYGHRFSRPKTSKSTLSMIVERPERLLASALGVSVAYVRLGERHAGGSSAPHPHNAPDRKLPFKIRRTSRMADITSQVVTNVHGTAWMDELKQLCNAAGQKLSTTGKELKRTPNSTPGQPLKDEFHEGDLYLSSESLNAFQGALGGVFDGVDAVFESTRTNRGPRRAFIAIRPPGHHCSADFPSGFCWLNNVHVGIQYASLTYGLTHAAIIDFDLHHGDGSQSITWDHNSKVKKMPKNTPNWKKTAIGYYSVHDINSYPCEWGEAEKVQNASLCIDNAHGQSIWNVHLQPWKTEEDFWKLYEERYVVLIEKARSFLRTHTKRLKIEKNQPTPKAAIFISAGFDASEWESQGMQRHKVNVPTEFYARFTKDIVRLSEEPETAVDGRVISVLEGGYSDRALASGVLSHLSGLCPGTKAIKKEPSIINGLGQSLENLTIEVDEADILETKDARYNSEWWHESSLIALESLVNPELVTVPALKKTTKTVGPHHFSSPTQSFTAKVVDPSKLHRTISGSMRAVSASPSRAPTPPPPDVDWATAAHELSKLLIPSNRQTKSCRPEELSEPRVKKEKPVPVVQVAAPNPSGRQLRGRKSQAPTYADPDTDDDTKSIRSVRTVSGTDRRKTIADFGTASTSTASTEKRSAPVRRMSIASSVGSVTKEEPRSRAGSIVSSRLPAPVPTRPGANAVVKKARVVTNPKLESVKSRSSGKIPTTSEEPKGAEIQSHGNSQENIDDMDALTTGLKRITLRLPPKEEYEARQRGKAANIDTAEKKKPTTKTTTRKAPASRTTKPGGTTKKPTVKDTKSSTIKRPTPAAGLDGTANSNQALTQPAVPIQVTAGTQLEQPQPVVPMTDVLSLQPISPPVVSPPVSSPPISGNISLMPPEDLDISGIPPDQLPQSQFTTPIALPEQLSPPRPDTPPPPPPTSLPAFIQYKPDGVNEPQQRQTASPNQSNIAQSNVQLQWLPPNSDPVLPLPLTSSPPAAAPAVSPARKVHELPVFSSSGVIPFAPTTNRINSPLVVGDHKGPEASKDAPPTATPIAMPLTETEGGIKAEQSIWDVPMTPKPNA